MFITERNCLRSLQGEGYEGNASTTVSGSACVDWSIYDDSLFTADKFTIGSITASYSSAENFCRSPMTEDIFTFPWCFIDDHESWEFCTVELEYCGMSVDFH